jgi:hypothetical protein
MNAFSFRAELPQDIDALESVFRSKKIEFGIKRHYDPGMPEVHVEMWVKATYDEVSAIMNDIDDGHLMYQTIAAGDFKTCGDLKRHRI